MKFRRWAANAAVTKILQTRKTRRSFTRHVTECVHAVIADSQDTHDALTRSADGNDNNNQQYKSRPVVTVVGDDDAPAMFDLTEFKSNSTTLQKKTSQTKWQRCGDPSTSGPHGNSKFTMTEVLRPIMGDAFVDNPKEERTDADKAKFSTWINLLKWYMCLKRVGINPAFTL